MEKFNPSYKQNVPAANVILLEGEASQHWFIENYSGLRFHFDHMFEAVESGEMPPAGATKLTNDEKDLFACWADKGIPE